MLTGYIAHDKDSEIRILAESAMVHDGRSEAPDIGVAANKHMEGDLTIDENRCTIQ